MDWNRDQGGAARLSLQQLPIGQARHALLSSLALKLGLSFAEVSRLTRELPATLDVRLADAERAELAQLLERAGASFGFELAETTLGACPAHARLAADLACARCGAPGCRLCVPPTAATLRCPNCRRRERRQRRFFLARVSVLLLILATVLLWALGDWRSRTARNDWQRPVNVAVILVARDAIEVTTMDRLRERLGELENVMMREARRHGVGVRPFQFVFYGPARAGPPPSPPNEEGLWPLIRHTYDQHRYVSQIDEALSIQTSAWDSRVYLVARQPRDERVQVVEGYGQDGGRVGIVEVELTTDMVDMVLAVGVHELFHTLGASDKYGPTGATLLPGGLVHPNSSPLLPQSHVEVMARSRPLDRRGHEAQLERIEELGVGPVTAKEIGWLLSAD